MGQLLWTSSNGINFQYDRGGFRLTVGRGQQGRGFHYTILPRDHAAPPAPIASGSSENLRDAIDAAERALASIDKSGEPNYLVRRPGVALPNDGGSLAGNVASSA